MLITSLTEDLLTAEMFKNSDLALPLQIFICELYWWTGGTVDLEKTATISIRGKLSVKLSTNIVWKIS